jgi:hypothetical protein
MAGGKYVPTNFLKAGVPARLILIIFKPKFKRMKMVSLFINFLTLYFCLSCAPKSNDPRPVITNSPGQVDKGWTFENTPQWADEFNYAGVPDPAKWGYDIGETTNCNTTVTASLMPV